MSGKGPEDGRGNGLFMFAVGVFVVLVLVFKSSFGIWINTDATAYVSIARQVLAGGFERSINGYWGPLLSWLMVPGLAAGQLPLVAARTVEVVAGLGALLAVRWLALRLGASRRSIGVLGLCCVVPLASYSMVTVTPDILLLLFVVLYCAVVLPETYRERRHQGAVAGLFGGLAYLSKCYALPFFLAHFFLITLLHLRRASGDADPAGCRRAVLRHFGSGLLVFALLAGPWIALMSHKYGTLTLGTSGQRAYALVGPEYYGDDPVFTQLIDPPSFDATSYWNDPALFKMVSWRPWDSEDLFYHQLWVIHDNFWDIVRMLALAVPFGLAALFYTIGAVLSGHKPPDRTGPPPAPGEVVNLGPDLHTYPLLRTASAPLLITVGIYTGGYSATYVELRYLWPVLILLSLMTVLILQQFAVTHRFRSAVWSFLATWLVIACAATPLSDLLSNPNRGREPLKLAKRLSAEYGVHGNLASNDNWAPSLFAAFHMGARYFGRVPAEARKDEQTLRAALDRHGIDYYLDWGPEDRLAPGPFATSRVPEVTGGKIKGLRVYALKAPPAAP